MDRTSAGAHSGPRFFAHRLMRRSSKLAWALVLLSAAKNLDADSRGPFSLTTADSDAKHSLLRHRQPHFPQQHLHVLPYVLLGGRIAQQVSRMIRDDDLAPLVIVRAAAHAA